MLSTITAVQQVQLELAAPIDTETEVEATPVRAAQVSVTGPTGRHSFSETRPGVYESAFRPAGGGEYHLEILLQNGRVVRGQATVPAPPEIVTPAESSVEIAGPEGLLTLEWRPSGDAAAYGISFGEVDTGDGTLRPFGGYTTDTTATLRVVSNCDSCCDGSLTLVLALDAAFLRYHGLPVSSDASQSDDRLEGALGLFTAVSGDSVVVVFGSSEEC